MVDEAKMTEKSCKLHPKVLFCPSWLVKMSQFTNEGGEEDEDDKALFDDI